MAAWAATEEKNRGSLDDSPNGVTLIEAGAYTAAAAKNEAIFSAGNATIVEVVVTATAKVSTPALCLCVDACDETTGTWVNLGQSVTLTDAGEAYLQINPFVPAVTNKSVQRVPRRRLRARLIHENTNALTFGVRAHGISL